MRLSSPAVKAAGQSEGILDLPVPDLWMQLPRPASIFSPWYCSYLDSETCKRRQYHQGRLETYMLKTILSMQDILLTVNQKRLTTWQSVC